MTNFTPTIYHGDCLDIMRTFDSDSVDLIITSPPYAKARSYDYGGINHNKYIDWFIPRAVEIKRIIKPTGSFILNIKENCVDGQRHTYVIRLILRLIEDTEFRWVEEYIWHKSKSFPGKWKYRFRDSWERLLHFTKSKDIKMFQDNVRTPMKKESISKIYSQNYDDGLEHFNKSGSKFSWKATTFRNEGKTALPTNVLYVTPSDKGKKLRHSAIYPDELPEFFIKLFTEENDLVLDPFVGSGTTCEVAQKLNRNSIGIELFEDVYYKLQEYEQYEDWIYK